jgi:hypothetical protein
MIFKEMIAAYSEYHTKLLYMYAVTNAKIWDVKSNGIHSCHCDVNG